MLSSQWIACRWPFNQGGGARAILKFESCRTPTNSSEAGAMYPCT